MFTFNKKVLLRSVWGGAVVAASLGVTTQSLGTILPHPTDVAQGDTYRWVFVTSTTTVGSSGFIATYDDHAAAAGAALTDPLLNPFTWQAIASVVDETVAITHVNTDGSSAPVYLINTAGSDFATEGVASDTTAGAGGLFDPLGIAIPVDTTELFAAPALPATWSGTCSSGTAAIAGICSADDRRLGSVTIVFGMSSLTTLDWLTGSATPPSSLLHVYAISNIITVPFSAAPAKNLGLNWMFLSMLGLLGATTLLLKYAPKPKQFGGNLLA